MKTKLILSIMFTFFLILIGCSGGGDAKLDSNINEPPIDNTPIDTTPTINTETFSFTTNGSNTNGKIYLPESYQTNSNLPAIYLIDFKEQHFETATDEFEKVVDAVKELSGFDALVVTLEEHLDIESSPNNFEDYYTTFKDMASYVDSNYTNNTSRTFIGRGSEAGIVIMAMFKENSDTSIFENFIATDSPASYNSEIINLIESGNFPQEKGNKKLHFSFSVSNDIDSCISMINKINEANYTWLQFESIRYQTDYPTTYPTAFKSGIAYIFN